MDIGGTQILMQGGMNPDLPLDWYLGLLRGIKERFPTVHVHAFSRRSSSSSSTSSGRPARAWPTRSDGSWSACARPAWTGLPGGGGEIFAPAVRRKIGLGKCDAQAWLTCMYVAHSLGMFTSATMMFGHIEGLADRIHHMALVRQWQDRALIEAAQADPTQPGADGHLGDRAFGHYKAFISWPFQRENTPLGRLREWGQDEQDQGPFPGDVVARLDGTGTKDLHRQFGTPAAAGRRRPVPAHPGPSAG
ncbi:MAG: hypothetical protein KatS3mg103_0957 [Phycisphaerales bacterium]|nr:MAG: hypothetical protein KatS3mg103_0957 [Phycisphaerales bacterium]